MVEINKRGVPCTVGSCAEIYREQAFIQAGLAPKSRLPTAARLTEASLMFQVHPTLTEEDMDWVASQVVDVLRQAQK